jgi:hypothetical protein
MNVALTIVGGLGLLVLGQIVIRSFIHPIYELRKLRGEIADALIYYANFYMNPSHAFKTPEIEAAGNALRSLGTRIKSRSHAVPFYRFFAFIGAVPTLNSIETASRHLIGLSNSIYRGDPKENKESRREIIGALSLKLSD